MLELSDGLGLDLPDALARDLEDASDLFEGVGVPVPDAVAQFEDLALAVGERLEELLDALAEHVLCGCVRRRGLAFVLDELAEVAVVALADGPVDADGVAADLHDAANVGDGHAGLVREFLHGRLAPGDLQDLLLDVAQPRHGLDHVDGDADGPGVIGDGAGDGLADPPRGVGGELVASLVLVLVHRPHEAGVALLDDVQERQPAVSVLLGDGDNEAEVAAGEIALGLLVLPEDGADGAGSGVELIGLLEDERAQAFELFAHDLEIVRVEVLGAAIGLPQVDDKCVGFGGDVAQLAHERDDAVRAEAQLLGECGHAPPPSGHPRSDLLDLVVQHGAGEGLVVGAERFEAHPVLLVEFEQHVDGADVDRDACGDTRLGVLLGRRDAHRSIERELAATDGAEYLDGLLDDVLALEAAATEDDASGLDLLREADFLGTGEQRDRAHLREIHADGVFDALGDRVVGDGRRFELFAPVVLDGVARREHVQFTVGDFLWTRRRGEAQPRGVRGALAAGDAHGAQRLREGGAVAAAAALPRDPLAVLHFIDEFNVVVVDEHEQLVEPLRVDHFVGKDVV